MFQTSSPHTGGRARWLYAAARGLYPVLAAGIVLLLTEWVARGTLGAEIWQQYILPHKSSYLLAWAFLLGCWLAVYAPTRLAALATVACGCVGCVPAAVNYYTLQLRGEPFLPWDLSQVSEAAGVAAAAGIRIQPSMAAAAFVVAALAVAGAFLYHRRPGAGWLRRLAATAAAWAALLGLVFGVYLQPAATQALGIYPDAWMQDRYYRWYGLITGFITNLTNLDIQQPEEYDALQVAQLLDDTAANAAAPLYANSYAATASELPAQPTIIYVMNESYWDVSELEQYGIRFDTDVSANLHRLQQSAAYGKCYSPSFGGGTCDVEFEALTGYSISFLPSGCKPYQQHVTHPMFALPQYLRQQGYQTAAVHGFWAKYWSRDTAYPNLGFDTFVSLEDMPGAEKVRGYYWSGGLVSDAAMAQQIIAQYEAMKASSGAPVFLHAVTMQNHTNYNAANYPDAERVRVTACPQQLKASTVGALEDFATGIRDADAMLGALTDYFAQVDEPVILVFWGDHYNPIDSGYDLYTLTGYASGSSADPQLHQTTLLVWANYSDCAVDLGTIAAYDISPVVLDLFGLAQPPFFRYLLAQLQNGYRARTGGVTCNVDGSFSQQLSEKQLAWYNGHWLLQYDLMFGEAYALAWPDIPR